MSSLASRARVVVISPCRDEERTLERTIACMRAQTRPPLLWVVVDDGSTDAPELPSADDTGATGIGVGRVDARVDARIRPGT